MARTTGHWQAQSRTPAVQRIRCSGVKIAAELSCGTFINNGWACAVPKRLGVEFAEEHLREGMDIDIEVVFS